MAVPTARSEWAQRVSVAVETPAGSGRFEVDGRLRAEMAEVLSDGRLAAARVAVQTDSSFTPAEARRRYHADRRMIVQTPEVVLFDGYPVAGRLGLGMGGSGRAGRGRYGGGDGYRLELEHVVGRSGRDPTAQILGRYVRDTVIEDGLAADPSAWAGATTLVTGLPCVFNMDGVGNCDPTPIEVDDGEGGVRRIHIFADDGRADAVRWTYARVLRYLLFFYGNANGFIDAAGVLTLTDPLAEPSGEGRSAVFEIDPLAYALLGRADTLVLEAVSLLEGLSLLAASSGGHVTTDSERRGGGVRTSWRVWSERSGPLRALRLATAARDSSGQPLYDGASKSARELFAENNLSSGQIAWDDRAIVSTTIILGDVKRYELQAELLPGWLPRAGLDNVTPSERADAKSAALTDEQILALGPDSGDDSWFRRYHRNGPEFSENWQVGRLWILNEAGEFPSSLYARNAPFDSYAPFDLSGVGPGRWMRRRRRLLPIPVAPGEEGRVVVEVSFDGGTTWASVASGYQVLAEGGGVWFDVSNPLSIAPDDGDETNLWYGLVDQAFRVRITGMIESDERLRVERHSSSAPTQWPNARLLYAPDRFQFVKSLTSQVTGGSGGPAVAAGGRDDTPAMEAAGASMMTGEGPRRVEGRVRIPWLDTEYQVGDRITGVRGRGLGFEAERASSRRYACVLGKRYFLGSGRFGTDLLLGMPATVGR